MTHYSDKQHGDTLSPTEPVAWLDVDDQGTHCGLSFYTVTGREVPLYIAPQPQPDHFRDAAEKVDDTALLRQALYLIEAWERGAEAYDYPFEIDALRERLK